MDGHGATTPSQSPVDEDTALLAALRDDIAASTQPEDRVSFTSDVFCALLDEVIRLRLECVTRTPCCGSSETQREHP